MNTVITIHHLHGQHNIRGKFGFGNIKWQKPTLHELLITDDLNTIMNTV